MGKTWNADRDIAASLRVRTPGDRALADKTEDADRLVSEVDQRILRVKKPERVKRPLSKVEQAMRRNAPDLAGGSPEEIAAARRRVTRTGKWPRPRLAALILFMILTVLHPWPFLRLSLWGLILFLALSVSIGPERAWDGARSLWRRFFGLWRQEILILRRFGHTIREHLEVWFRTAL